MSGLLGDLLNNAKALEVHRQQIQTAGRNLAHLNDPTYARQRVVSGPASPILTPNAILPTGVEFLGFQQARNQIMDTRILEEQTDEASWKARYFAARDMENALGEFIAPPDGVTTPDNNPLAQGKASLSSGLVRFFNAFQDWSADPTDPVRRQAVLDRSNELTGQFNQVDEQIAETEAGWVAQIEQDASQANLLLDKLARLNQQMIRLEASGKGIATDLRDTRQATLEELSQLVDFKTDFPRGSEGGVRLQTRAADGSMVTLVDGPELHGGYSYDSASTTLRFGTPPANLDPHGGSIHGALQARQNYLLPIRAQVDALARQLVVSVNGVYATAPGAPAFFDPAATTAASISLDSALTASNLVSSLNGQPGDNVLARNIASLADRSFDPSAGDAIQGRFIDAVADMTEQIGRAVNEAESLYEAQQLSTKALTERRNEISGVSLDEEVSDLMRFQHAFEGTARVMRVLDELLDTVVNNLAR